MKKLIALILALTVVMSLAACGVKDNTETTGAATQATTEATTEATGDATEGDVAAPEGHASTQVMTNIWNSMDESKKFFAMGGDMENMVDNAPGNYSLDDEGISTVLYVPVDQIANIDEASSLMHGMMANHFTGGVFHLTDSANVAAFADAMKASIGSAQWICGTPEKLLIAVINTDYVLAVYGLNDNIVAFEEALGTAYEDAEIKYSEAIGG